MSNTETDKLMELFKEECREFWQCPSCLRETDEDYHCGENCFLVIETPSEKVIDADDKKALMKCFWAWVNERGEPS